LLLTHNKEKSTSNKETTQMAIMGNYCKAYLIKQLRTFPSWQEKIGSIHSEIRLEEQPHSTQPDSFNDEDIVYLQENYVVTHGVFKDEHIVFDAVTDEWRNFCQHQLSFQIPDYASAAIIGNNQ
jgi:hypothetical protein